MKFNRLQGENYVCIWIIVWVEFIDFIIINFIIIFQKLIKSTAFVIKPKLKKNTFKVKNQYNTSCGEITCDHPENYPEDLIKKLYIKKFGIKVIIKFKINNLIITCKFEI